MTMYEFDRMIEQIVLVVGLGFVETFQRIDARDDLGADTQPALSSCAM